MEAMKAKKLKELAAAAQASQSSNQSQNSSANGASEANSSKANHKTEEDADAEDEEEALKDILPMNLLEGEDLVDMDNLMADDEDITKTNLDDMGGKNRLNNFSLMSWKWLLFLTLGVWPIRGL